MLLVFSTIKVAQLRPKPYRVLGVAMVLILAMDPLASLSAGFWLSFGTVAFIVFCCHGYLKPRQRFREAVRLHVILGLFTLPLGAWFFQSGSLVAPLANLVAIPLVSLLIVPLILISILLLGVLPSMAAWFYIAALELLSWMVAGLSLLQSMGGAISLSLSTLAVLVLCMVGVLVVLLPLNWHVRWLALVMVLPAVLQASGVRKSADELELHVLDVGQGQAILLIHKNRVVLYDTGGVLGREDTMFDSVVMPFLLQSGYRHIDHAIISHADQDHAAGVESLRRHFPDIEIAASDPDALPVPGVSPCESGQQWTFNAVRMTVLQPAHFDEWSDNDRSCVVLVEFGNSKILLTGDIEALAERRLASRLGQFPVDVMTSPHHGSATSSTDHLLNTFRPRFVVVSSGWRNAYGFPHREVQMRYKLAGINMLVTGLQGALSFRFDELGLKEPPSGHWQKRTQPWHEVRELGALIK